MKNIFKIAFLIILFTACSQVNKDEDSNQEETMVNQISDDAKKVRDYVVKNAVIAHRGSTYWTPEETEPALRWARNIGADYLEFDLQMTKDSLLIALHDSDLSRTTNISEIFPDRVNSPAIEFTLKELRSLDAGSWFNEANPDRARDGFVGLSILTFKDVVMIAEGFRIKKEDGVPVKEMTDGEWTGYYLYEADPNDNGHRPGIYAETKKPNLEKILAKELAEYGWSINENPKTIETLPNKVGIANTNGRFVLQSFAPKSIQKLEEYLPNIPKCLLLWQPDMVDSLETVDTLRMNYNKAIEFGIENNVHFIGSSIAGEPNNYKELTAPWMADLVHESGMHIHPYTFDTNEQLETYKNNVEGVFTNRADMALAFYGRASDKTPEEILEDLGY